jgi:hypothetical protein
MKRMKERFRGALYRYAGCHRIDAFLKQRDFSKKETGRVAPSPRTTAT